jgi:DNA-binding PadR family transcriptional regulator
MLAARRLLGSGVGEFHGYGISKELAGGSEQRPTIGYGTLYRALARLERAGYLESRWEASAPEGRPRRRLYSLTAAGAQATLTVFAGQEPALARA